MKNKLTPHNKQITTRKAVSTTRSTSFQLIWFFLTACGPLNTDPKPFPILDRTPPYNIPNNKTVKKKDYLDCPTGTFLTYDNFGENFFLNNCTSCHSSSLIDASEPENTIQRQGAPVSINLDTPEDIEINRDKILIATRAKFQSLTDGSEEPTDSDGDGIADREEDTDGDGIPDVNEDENGNGIPDVSETGSDTDDSIDPSTLVLMPPGRALPIETLKLLKEYLECGAQPGSDNIK